MDYANAKMQAAGAALGGNASRPIERPLESLSSAVLRINGATVNVQGFLARFRGHEPTSDYGDPAAIEPQPAYGVSLERLFEAINRLEAELQSLNQIG